MQHLQSRIASITPSAHTWHASLSVCCRALDDCRTPAKEAAIPGEAVPGDAVVAALQAAVVLIQKLSLSW